MSTAPLATGTDAAGAGPWDEAREPAEPLSEGVYARLPWHLAGQRSELLAALGSRAALARAG
ncbi:hypothetical protein ACLESO_56210 [Pyxidicoccus sp. 3LG]